MICTANRNGASSAAYCTASEIITAARQSAECTGLRDRIIPRAPSTITGASNQNATSAPISDHLRGRSSQSPVALVRLYRADLVLRVRLAAEVLVLSLVLVAGVDRARLEAADVARPVVGRAHRGQAEEVGLLVVAEAARVRRLLHARQQRTQQVVLVVDQVGAVVVRQLELVGHRQRPGRARLDAQAAQDAAQVVDLVDAAVALTGAEALVVGVGGTLDVDRVGRAGPGAQLAPNALLQAVGPAVELVPAVEARGR